MDSSKIPVTYDFFKKYTYHEEWVDMMFKAKAKGNQQVYDALSQSPESKEKALKLYYAAFYLKPQIREKYHIRVKPVPKKIKDHLLQIPDQETNEHSSNNSIPHNSVIQNLINENMVSTTKSGEVEMSSSERNPNNLNMQQKHLFAQDIGPNDKEIEDDSEPFSSPENSGTIKETNSNLFEVENEKEKTSMENNNSNDNINNSLDQQAYEKGSPKKSCEEREKTKRTATVEDDSQIIKNNFNKSAELLTIAKETQPEYQTNDGVKAEYLFQHDIIKPADQQSIEKEESETQSVDQKRSLVNYKDLIPYIHCCPLTYKEFRKYSNINQLIQEFCKKKGINMREQRFILNRSYILFYLAPEHRTTTPINKIQLIDDCPTHIREKFFSIPTSLYLKEQADKKKEENVEVNKEQSISGDANSTETIPQAQEQNNLPVTLEEFKKYTHYESVIDNLFKNVAHNNEHIYWKYKNSEEAFIGTLMNYYRAFYLIPVTREKFPINFKPIPNSLKCRLLQIPQGVDIKAFTNIRAEQLVFPQLHVFSEIKLENDNVTDKDMVKQNLIEVQESKTQEPAAGSAVECTKLTSSSEANNQTISCGLGLCEAAKTQLPIMENDVQRAGIPLKNSCKANSPVTSIKRNSKNVIDQPSPKRLRMQQEEQTNNILENNEDTKKHYKDLLPYAHCCPVTFSQFKKYTNITELFTGYCLSRYKDLKKLPYIIKRAYILYYLAPENRKFKPFNKLQLTDSCPQNLKEKMFEIPTNLYEQEEKLQAHKTKNPNLVTKEEINSESQQLPAADQQKKVVNNQKETIEILENRLLPPTTLNLSNHFASSEGMPSVHCLNSNCVFHYISHHDFMQQTNILQILPQPKDINEIKSMFKKFIHKIIRQNICDEIYIHGNLLSKILKHHNICENCESGIIEPINGETAEISNETEQDRAQIEHDENLNKNSSGDSERLQSMVVGAEHAINKSLTIKENEKLFTNASVSRSKIPDDLVKCLKQEKTFQKFRQKLLSKLSYNFDNTVDFSSDTYNIFLQCNEIPLEQILYDFCSAHKDIVKRILNDQEICQALQRFYYFKYLTNPNFGLKYPVYIKHSEENSNLEQDHNTEVSKANNKTKEVDSSDNVTETGDKLTNNDLKSKSFDGNKLVANSNALTKHQDSGKISPKNMVNDNKALEKAKRIFFRNVDKTSTLSYVVRTSFGLKQQILRNILSLSYEEFLKLTNIYEGQLLYNDSHVSKCMYRFVFLTPAIWPINLYIKLEDLCKYLIKKNVRFNNYSTMLKYISPKVLHWSDLRSCTTIEKCVKIDYEKRTGNKLNLNDETLIAHECNEYYNRCWKYDEWLQEVPILYTEFYRNCLSKIQPADVTMRNDTALIEITLQSTANVLTTKDMVDASSNSQQKHSEQSKVFVEKVNSETLPEYVAEIDIETTSAVDTSSNANLSMKELNCILLPNTQQQISMLPDETTVTSDPLYNIFSDIPLNESLSSNGSSIEVISLGEINQTIKTEPIKEKLLSNLLFYEDDDSNIKCIPCQEEIVNLDETISQVFDNLPPSQLHFDEVISQEILSDDLIVSGNSNSALNLAQPLPSSIESNGTLCSQQFLQLQNKSGTTSTQTIQLPDVSLGSNGEIENQQQHQQSMDHGNDVIQNLIQLMSDEKTCIENSPNTLEELSNILHQFQNSSESSSILFNNLPVCTIVHNSLENTPCCSTTHNINVVQNNLEMESQNQLANQANKAHSLAVETDNNLHKSAISTISIRKCTNVAAKCNKNVAKVRPLKNSNLVPQIQHLTRPLATKPAYPSDSSRTTNTPALILQNSSTAVPSIENTTALRTLRISQELNTNCSVFDNSSLLRIVDHNYYQQSATNSTPQNVILTTNSPLEVSKLPSPRSMNREYLESNSQESNTKSPSKFSTLAEVTTTKNSVFEDNEKNINAYMKKS